VLTSKTFQIVMAGIVALSAAAGARAADLVKVRVGVTSSSSDAGFFIADKKGYFRKEGLEVTLISFDSAAKMVAPLGVGQLEVGGGAPSAGLYNALSRGIDIRIVADKGSTPPGYDYQPLLVRKDHIDSGRYKSLKDLNLTEWASLLPILVFIFWIGVYPNTFLSKMAISIENFLSLVAR